MSKPKPATSNAEPMIYETFVMPNLSNERSRLVREAAGLSRDELVERAGELGVPTGGSKEAIAERVRDAARAD